MAVADSSLVSNVSDTARWVAVYRARETARPDALFDDPYAELFSGQRGRDIAALMPRHAANGWPIITRTKLIDQLVLDSIVQGADCILNLAAGFDVRPYRLELPPSLRWVEADLPALIEEKEYVLANARPVCQLIRIKVDLADPLARAALLESVVSSAGKTVVITEGLLLYLDAAEVRSLAADLFKRTGIAAWILDLASPGLLKMLQKSMGPHFANAPMKFGPPNGVAFFEALGWSVDDVTSILHAAARFRRLPLLLRIVALFPEPDPRMPAHAPWTGVVKLRR
jgi:methyltransferase (TIGR00027 family)